MITNMWKKQQENLLRDSIYCDQIVFNIINIYLVLLPISWHKSFVISSVIGMREPFFVIYNKTLSITPEFMLMR